MKKLVLYLLPVILLSVMGVRQSLLFNGIGVPVLMLWAINALIAWMPERVERGYGSESSASAGESREVVLSEPAVSLQEETRHVA